MNKGLYISQFKVDCEPLAPPLILPYPCGILLQLLLSLHKFGDSLCDIDCIGNLQIEEGDYPLYGSSPNKLTTLSMAA